MSSLTSRRALLDIIEEKERELIRIRNAAENVAEEEKVSLQQRLTTMESDMERNVSSLKDRQAKIEILQNDIKSIESRYVQQLQELESSMQAEMNQRIRYIEDDLKQEATRQAEKFEQEQRKKLKAEFEDRLEEREKNLRLQYLNKLEQEMANQERELQLCFEKTLTNQKREFEQAESDWVSKLRRKDYELETLTLSMDKEWNRRQKDLEEEIERHSRTEIQRSIDQLDMKRDNDIRRITEERNVLLNQCECMAKDIVRLEEDRSILDDKLHELLGIVQYVEIDYEEKLREHEMEVQMLEKQVHDMKETIIGKERESKRLVTSLQDEIYQTKKKYKMEKESQMKVINELKKELSTATLQRSEVEGIYRLQANEALQSNKMLEKDLASMKKEQEQLRKDYDRKVQKLNWYKAKNRKLESDALNERMSYDEGKWDLTKRIETKLKEEKENAGRELLRLSRERDDAIADKDRVIALNKRATTQHEFEYHSELEYLTEENARLNSELRSMQETTQSVKMENNQLKAVIASMRKEMENIIHCASQSDRESNIDEDLVKDELYSDAIKLLIDLKKIAAALLTKNGSKQTAEPLAESSIFYEKINDIEKKLHAISSQLHFVVNHGTSDAKVSKTKENERGDYNLSHHEQSIPVRSSSAMSIDGINISDLAQSVWSQAIIQPPRHVKASDRSTKSQDKSLERMRKESEKKYMIKSEKRIRNWNQVGD